MTTNIRFATFNASLNRNSAGQLAIDLSTPGNAQARAVAEIIQRNNPDVILINEFDFDPAAVDLFKTNYLAVSQNGATPITDYNFTYIAPSNTGIASGFDLDNNGTVVTTPGTPGYGNDAFGFGNFEGQFGMLLLSRYQIDTANIRTFQRFLWKDMPNSLLTNDPSAGADNLAIFYSAAERDILRLSSKSHWDVPIIVDGETIHVLASHPTPPVFDGTEDRNGKRNFDEIRFWADYINPNESGYIYDDAEFAAAGNTTPASPRGGLAAGERFVIMGDQNADPFDGDSFQGAANQLLKSPFVNVSQTPGSLGGPDAAERQGALNNTSLGDPALDTADFGPDTTVPNLRVDYVLPSYNTTIVGAGVFWPKDEDPLFGLVGDFPFPSSDHRLVYADVALTRIGSSQNRQTVPDGGYELLGGEVSIATGTIFNGTQVGGLSGLVYDPNRQVYYAISDDRSNINPARFYTLTIDLSDGTLDDGDVVITDVTTLLDNTGTPFAANSLDPEGIALSSIGTLYISSEGEANPGIPRITDPFVNQFSLNTGRQISELPVNAKFAAVDSITQGIRNNLAFESLTITPDQRFLYTATENALAQDGTFATTTDGSLSRIIKYDLTTGLPVAEYVYEVEPVPDEPVPAGSFATNGLVELLAIDNNGTLLALERGFSSGVGNTVKIFEVQTQGALNVIGFNDLFDEGNGVVFEIDPAVRKREILDVEADLGIEPDNLEAIAFGPKLPDGRQSLIIASDNNFSPTQKTQFIALALDLKTVPAVLPTVETPLTIDDDAASSPLLGDSDDPAIWVDPVDSNNSIVIVTLKDGGLAVLDLEGQILQTITPANIDPAFGFGDIRYNNVDLVYNFQLAGQLVDIAVASDRARDTLAIFQIDPTTRQLTNITATDILPTIFGVDDGEATAYGLATYTSPVSGKSYAFVTQADGNKVAQLELTAKANGTVGATLVRTIELPVPTGDPEDSQSEGLVVDQELGFLYVALEGEVGILKFSAEPNGGNSFTLVRPVDSEELVPDIEGLNIYYGPNGTGYLIVNSQGDSSYAVYTREGTNEYLGSFIVGENLALGIDQVNESDGLDVINVPVGDRFPFGLLVLQDGAEEPQNVVVNDEELENNATNFKYVPWQDVANAFDIPLLVDPISYNPRNPVQAQSLVNGVASGDVTQDSAVLWARSTFLGLVTFEYSTDQNFGTIVGSATATVTDINQPVKVKIGGLSARTEYFYRVTDAAGDTEIGRFLTAAPIGEKTGLRFGIAGDWQQAPPYPILNSAAASDLDFFLKLGDTIYADLETPATPGVSQARTLEQFRAKHSEVLSPRFGLSATSDLYKTTSVLATIDDHEIVDNFAGGAAPGESPDAPDIGSSPDPLFTDNVPFVNETQAYKDALQAFQEYHPQESRFYDTPSDPRTNGKPQLYRNQTFGGDASVFMLDSRSFRDAQLPAANLANPTEFLVNAFDPTRTLLGRPQVELLKEDLLAAEVNGITWKFIVIPEPIQNFGVVNAEDRFEGYAAERTEILKFIQENDIDNVVFMAGDFHGTIVNNLTYQEGPGQAQIATSAFEVVTGPVAFFDGRFGPAVANISLAAGLISPAEFAFYNSLPVNPDADNALNDRDDFIKQLLVAQTSLFGYDPVGLNANLDQANGLIDATLLQGDYVAVHNYSWTEFDIDPITQALTVTTYGIEAYSEEDVLADPQAVINRQPVIISQFVVNPSEVESEVGFDLKNSDEEAGVIALRLSDATLNLKITSLNTSFVNELVIFKVEDAEGSVRDSSGNLITPGSDDFTEADYLQAILDSDATEALLSSLDASDNLPDSFRDVLEDLQGNADFAGRSRLGFLLAVDSTLEEVKANPDSETVFISTLGGAEINNLTSSSFTLAFGDDGGFDDLIFEVKAEPQDNLINEADEFLKVGRTLQVGGKFVEAIDLANPQFDFNNDGTADIITGRGVNVTTTLYREAAFNNLIGFYAVDPATGAVNGIAPTAANRQAYAAAAFNSRVGQVSAPSNQSTATSTFTFIGGQLLLPFIISNASTPNANFSNIYFPFLDVNADGADHIRLLGNGVFGFEDIAGGGDQDFDDVIVQVTQVNLA